MCERIGHPSRCNYYYAMRYLLGLDPRREEDKKFFNMLIETGEISPTVYGNGQISDTLFDTDSILAYRHRQEEKVKEQLEKFTQTIMDFQKQTHIDMDLLKKSIDNLAGKIGELIKTEEEREIPPWEQKG